MLVGIPLATSSVAAIYTLDPMIQHNDFAVSDMDKKIF